MPIDLPSGATPLWLVIMGGFMSLIAVGVGVYRKWKAGEIADDGILLDRVNKDNSGLRLENISLQKDKEALNALLDEERTKRRRAEDAAAIYYRQLLAEKIQPEEVK